MTRAPLGRVDMAALGTFSAATGVDRLVQATAESPVARFVDQAVWTIIWDGVPVILTPTDIIAMASGLVLIIRFLVWVLAGVFSIFRKRGQ